MTSMGWKQMSQMRYDFVIVNLPQTAGGVLVCSIPVLPVFHDSVVLGNIVSSVRQGIDRPQLRGPSLGPKESQ